MLKAILESDYLIILFKKIKTMVEILKTNVESQEEADDIITVLKKLFPDYKINFDLEDCDKILRIEAKEFDVENVVQNLNMMGYKCLLLH